MQTLWEGRPRIVWICLIAILLLVIKTWWAPSPDATSYLSMARSLAAGEGLRNLSSPHLYYPPGYAILISPLFLIQEHPFLLLSILQFILSALVVYVVYRWARPILGDSFSLGLVALIVCNAAFIHYASMTLSEVSFMLWLLLASLVLGRALFARGLAACAGWALLGALLVLFASTTRQVGIMVVAGCFCVGVLAAWRREGSWIRAFAVPLVAGLPALIAVMWLMRHDKEMARLAGTNAASYVEQLRLGEMTWLQILQQFIETARIRIMQVGRLLVPGFHGASASSWLNVNMPLFLAATALTVFAWWRMVRPLGERAGRGWRDVMLWTVPFYVSLYLVFPWIAGLRYFTPILPVFWIGICALLLGAPRFRYIVITALVVAHLAVALVYLLRDDISDRKAFRQYWPACVQLSREIGVGRQGVGARGLGKQDNVLYWTSYLIDRRVLELQTQDPIPESTDLILQLAETPAATGFELSSESGDLRLFRRAPAGQ